MSLADVAAFNDCDKPSPGPPGSLMVICTRSKERANVTETRQFHMVSDHVLVVFFTVLPVPSSSRKILSFKMYYENYLSSLTKASNDTATDPNWNLFEWMIGPWMGQGLATKLSNTRWMAPYSFCISLFSRVSSSSSSSSISSFNQPIGRVRGSCPTVESRTKRTNQLLEPSCYRFGPCHVLGGIS